MLYIVSKRSKNDFSNVFAQNNITFTQVPTLLNALKKVKKGDAVAVLADNYPALNPIRGSWQNAAKNGVNFFFEFPQQLDGVEFSSKIAPAEFERTVVTSSEYGTEEMTILIQHGCYLREVKSEVQSILVAARVAGYRKAIYGLPEKFIPICFRHPQFDNVLIGNGNFSSFVSARFAPQPDWAKFFEFLFSFLSGKKTGAINWEMAVRPTFGSNAKISGKDELTAFKRNCKFLSGSLLSNYHNTGLLVAEGYSAQVDFEGRQLRRQLTRGDCTGEVAMVFALDYKLNKNIQSQDYARRILDFLFTSDTLICLDKKSPVYGQLNFFEHTPAFYGDDNFRAIIGAALTAKLLKTKKWNKPILRNLHSVLNTTGKLGFRRDRLDVPSSFTDGKDLTFYQNEELVLLRPHAQAYLFAGFLLGWKMSGEEKFLTSAKSAINIMMKAYPKVNWTNGLSQEKARMLLPLAWLVQLENTQEHRDMLDRVVKDIEELMQPCGAVAEQMGDLSMGDFPSPKTNEAYGTTEAALIQENGDPACDLLYTVNFAAIGLHEAAMATGNAKYAELSDRITKFLCKVQIRSTTQPYLDGCWMRGFDWNLWDYYGSSADAGWGAWCVESGWTNNWIATTMALRSMNKSLWQLL